VSSGVKLDTFHTDYGLNQIWFLWKLHNSYARPYSSININGVKIKYNKYQKDFQRMSWFRDMKAWVIYGLESYFLPYPKRKMYSGNKNWLTFTIHNTLTLFLAPFFRRACDKLLDVALLRGCRRCGIAEGQRILGVRVSGKQYLAAVQDKWEKVAWANQTLP
jgi:hypothetical protein